MKKEKVFSPPTKVVIRHLPSGLTEEEFLEVVKPLPQHNWLSFHKANIDYGSLGFCRAYINFCNHADIYAFRDQFDGYVFVDGKGNESAAVVEYAPFQKLALRDASPKRPDARMGTISSDPDYLQFVQALENPEPASLPGTEKMLEDLECSTDENMKTPLVEYIEQKRMEILRKLQNRSQLDKLNTRQLERVLKKEERKEYVRLRKAEKRRLRLGERSARKYAKHPTEEDFEDEYDEYEDVLPPTPKGKALSPRGEKGSSGRASEAPAKLKARREKKAALKKPLPEKDKLRRPETEGRLYDKDSRPSQASPKLETKKVFVIKRRGDLAAEESKVPQCTSSEQHQELSSLSSRTSDDSKNSASDFQTSIMDGSGDSDMPNLSSRSRICDDLDTTANISKDNSSNSADVPLPGNENLSLDSKTSDSDAAALCLSGNDSKSCTDDLLDTVNDSPKNKDNNSEGQNFSDSTTDHDTAPMVSGTTVTQNNSVSHEEPSEKLESQNEEDSSPEVSASPVGPSCNEGDSKLCLTGDSETSASLDAVTGTTVDTTANKTVDTAIRSTIDTTTDRTAETVTDKTVDSTTGATSDIATDTAASTANGTFVDTGSGASEEPSRTAESGDDSKSSADPRTVRKIRNKDRPAMQLYRPGQCRLSSARLKQDNGVAPAKDASSSHSSTPSPVMSGVIQDATHQGPSLKRTDDPLQKSQVSQDHHQLARGSSEAMSRGKDRLSREDPPSVGSSSAGRGEKAGPPSKKRPAKTLEFTSQRHNRGGGGGRGADRLRGRFVQAKNGGSLDESRGPVKSPNDGEVAAASGGGDGEAGQSRGNDSAASATAGGVVKSQGKRYSRMRPAEK